MHFIKSSNVNKITKSNVPNDVLDFGAEFASACLDRFEIVKAVF